MSAISWFEMGGKHISLRASLSRKRVGKGGDRQHEEEEGAEAEEGDVQNGGRAGVRMRKRLESRAERWGGGTISTNTSLFSLAAAFPASATMSCATLLLPPHHCNSHTGREGRGGGGGGGGGSRETHTLTWLQQTRQRKKRA